jgi:hypothetical protein
MLLNNKTISDEAGRMGYKGGLKVKQQLLIKTMNESIVLTTTSMNPYQKFTY